MLRTTLARWRHHRQAERELMSLTDRELADLGVSRCDIPAVVRGRPLN